MVKQQLFVGMSVLVFCCSWGCKSVSRESHAYTNALINQSSPYLLQHAHNPVNWYPWGEEALARAQAEDKLLLISIGYAACHWCHVMEHESFEDTLVARVMNDNFVAIKVDREERPDVDDVYMTACQLASDGSCGWPLNAIALPDGRPIWAGTYFPRRQWLEVLQYFIQEKADKGPQMVKYAEQLTQTIHALGQLPSAAEGYVFSAATTDRFAQQLLQGLDHQQGGRKGAPKFPMPDNMQWLQAYAFYTGNQEARQVWETTLDHLAAGGIYDHLGGGFARYSTDADWLVPHFEKMSYDNSQLVSLFSAAYAQTGKERYREVVKQTLDFVKRELTSSTGCFYSSLDADSDGEEGKFYVWRAEELDSLLSPAEAQLVSQYYGVTKAGNWEQGKNILHTSLAPGSTPTEILAAVPTGPALLASAQAKLFAARSQRVRPGLDDKMLTAWNALMIKGYADAAAALREPSYLNQAIAAANALFGQALQADGRLWRNTHQGKSSINAFLDDYAFAAQACLRLYELTFDEHWLEQAQLLADYARAHFSNPNSDLLFYTADLDPPLVSRRTEIQDNVIAGSNSAMAEVFWQLGIYLDREDYTTKSERMLATVLNGTDVLRNPSFFANWGQLLLRQVYPPYEVAIVGADWPRVSPELQARYLPHALFLGGTTEGSLALLENKLVAEETYIYVCRNKVCKLPVKTAQAALDLLK
ncbi:MAG: thioredoxin domain-containing protein [Bacteroidetes bacterium]|nr:MAG: thioredoxin domain-containing protein [Bacteroidota bacterium]PTM13572.1 MAG: thioredoxin domain-containing protein [Bacteroidota bacterium]